MKKLLFCLSLMGMVFLTSCGTDKDTITASEAQDEASASEDAHVYTLNTDISSTTWRGFKIFDDSTKPEEGHYGSIKMKSGEVTMKHGVLESGKFVADQTSLENDDLADSPEYKAKLEGHLKSADFLDVDQYPEATFVVSGTKTLEEGDYNTEISGNLDFRGAPKNITFKANVKEEDGKLTINSEEFKINRQDFGINFQPGAGTIIKDEVVLQVNITAELAK
ncbi:MAG: YceI family protein [Weeksellaceae bacterium]|nr:YceI family protein [Weeksellaceae bacterium]